MIPPPEVMIEAAAIGSDRRPADAGYSSPGCTCPRCHDAAARVPRRLADLLLRMVMTISRYRCRSVGCGWEGNLRVKRHVLLIRGPW